MSREKELTCVISGSFNKFKPEIDLVIEEFKDLGVNVLAPEKGWLYIPVLKQFKLRSNSIRPLPSELNLPKYEIENNYLRALDLSNFVYVVNPEGYIGDTASFEIGYATGKEIPIFSQTQIPLDLDQGLAWKDVISAIIIQTPQEVVNSQKTIKLNDIKVRST